MREIGSEFEYDDLNIKVENTFFKNENIDFFRSGRDCLRYIARINNKKYKKVLIPSLSCKSMYEPFESEGYNVEFYKLNMNLSADIEDIEKKYQASTIVLFMNYFGNICITNEIIVELRSKYKEILLVKDSTHEFLKFKDELFDYVVSSIRKWVPSDSGGILYSKIKSENLSIPKDIFFGTKKEKISIIKKEYLLTKDIELKKEYLTKFRELNSFLDLNKEILLINDNSLKKIRSVNYNFIEESRIKNCIFLNEKLKTLSKLEFIPIDLSVSNLYFPILLDNRDFVQKKLSEQGIYCPVIWPVAIKAQKICDIAKVISSRMLAIPCDQRYSLEDMNYIFENLKKIMGEFE